MLLSHTPDNGALTFAAKLRCQAATHITDRLAALSAPTIRGCVSVTPLHDGLPGETITVVESWKAALLGQISSPG